GQVRGARCRMLHRIRRVRLSLAALIALITVVGSCAGLFRIFLLAQQGHRLTAAQANNLLVRSSSPLRIPADGTDVTFKAAFAGASASFDIDVSAFFAWVRQHGWQAVPIEREHANHIYSLSLCFGDEFPPVIL